ncbi:MAG: hypothetical protein AAGF86_02645 [Pseudomonadota bacterium]
MSGLEPYIDGELSLEDKLQFEAQLKRDSEMAEAAQKLETLNELLGEHSQKTKAPESLRAAVFDKFDIDGNTFSVTNGPRPGRLGRRSFLIGAGGTLAAGVAGLGVLSTFRSPATRPESAVETFFHDFETYLAKDKAIDIAETSMVRLAQWYGSRLPFRLPPVGSAGQAASLVGGRLCWLLERRLASLSYESQDGSMVLYIMNADGIAVPEGRSEPALGENVSWHRSDNHTSLVWRSDALLYVMVSQFEVRRLMAEARALVG